MILLFLSSGLFLGWSLGANDAANVFGTAVATRMVRFRAAAIVTGLFVVVGAVLAGGGTTATLGHLGAVNALGGSFMVALAAALAVMWMTRSGLPVSVSQAIIGGIVGWNIFTGTRTDVSSLVKIVSSWVACPILAAGIAALLYLAARALVNRVSIHLLELDALMRYLLIAAGAFGAFALGANNIANVMGVFVPAFPARTFPLFGTVHVSVAEVLFFVGGLAIAVGVFTYSQRVMQTVGKSLFKLNPVTALVVVLAESLVLFLFASEALESWLVARGLPSIPLVPVSSSQAVIGAVMGIALVRRGRGVKFGVLGRVAGGWVTTPVIAAVVAFLGLFFLQNVFGVTVRRPVAYELTSTAVGRLADRGEWEPEFAQLTGTRFQSEREFRAALSRSVDLGASGLEAVLVAAEIDSFVIDPSRLGALDPRVLDRDQMEAVRALSSKSYRHRWDLEGALSAGADGWARLPDTRANRARNKAIDSDLRYVFDTFRVWPGAP
jgi:PiT family inorganic phosphate transporter